MTVIYKFVFDSYESGILENPKVIQTWGWPSLTSYVVLSWDVSVLAVENSNNYERNLLKPLVGDNVTFRKMNYTQLLNP